MRKVVSLLLAIVFVCAILPFSSVSAATVIYINNENELYLLEENPDAEFYLTKDIYINNEHDVMFKSEDAAFMGTLDGCGYSIIFMNVNSNSDAVAFIGYLKGTIKNINFKDAYVNTDNADAVVSGVVSINCGRIENCTFSGKVMKCGREIVGNNIYGRNKVSLDGFVDDSSQSISSNIQPETVYSSSNTTIASSYSSASTSSTSQSTSSVSDFNASSVIDTSSEDVVFEMVIDKSDKKNTDTLGLIIMLISSFLLASILIYAVYREYRRTKEEKKDKK